MTIADYVIHHHEEKIKARTYVRIESFGVKRKYVGGFQKVNMSFAILVHKLSFFILLNLNYFISLTQRLALEILKRSLMKVFQWLHSV